VAPARGPHVGRRRGRQVDAGAWLAACCACWPAWGWRLAGQPGHRGPRAMSPPHIVPAVLPRRRSAGVGIERRQRCRPGAAGLRPQRLVGCKPRRGDLGCSWGGPGDRAAPVEAPSTRRWPGLTGGPPGASVRPGQGTPAGTRGWRRGGGATGLTTADQEARGARAAPPRRALHPPPPGRVGRQGPGAMMAPGAPRSCGPRPRWRTLAALRCRGGSLAARAGWITRARPPWRVQPPPPQPRGPRRGPCGGAPWATASRRPWAPADAGPAPGGWPRGRRPRRHPPGVNGLVLAQAGDGRRSSRSRRAPVRVTRAGWASRQRDAPDMLPNVGRTAMAGP